MSKTMSRELWENDHFVKDENDGDVRTSWINPSFLVVNWGHMPLFGGRKLFVSPEMSCCLGEVLSSTRKGPFCSLNISPFFAFYLEQATVNSKIA